MTIFDVKQYKQQFCGSDNEGVADTDELGPKECNRPTREVQNEELEKKRQGLWTCRSDLPSC